MTTIPFTGAATTAEGVQAAEGYWLFGPRADVGWFGLSLLVPLLLYLPAYWIFGSAAVWPLYAVYVACFATPHTWFTYAVTATPTAEAGGWYSRTSFWAPYAATLGLVALIPVAEWAGMWDLFFTMITMVGFYHVYKQHLGLLRIYDARYAQVHEDRSIFAAMAPFHALCALAFALPVFWVWLQPEFEVVIGVQRFTLLHPVLPAWALLPYLAAMAWFGGRAAWALAARRRAGRPLPVGHLVLAGAAAVSYVAAFGLVPPKDYLLTVAIFITYHDIQYAGFVWHFQRSRSEVEAEMGTPLDAIHRWALERKALPYFGVAFLFSLAILAVLVAVPPAVALAVIVLHNNLHYFMDGCIWQRKHNPLVHAHLGM
jgi:hypothetical protein